jgi:hypothetical protein
MASWLFREFHYNLFHLRGAPRIAAAFAISTVAPIDAWRNLFVMESRQGGTFE